MSAPPVEITREKGRVCREILEALPAWFGVPEALEQYVADVEDLPMFGIVWGGRTLGFITLRETAPTVAEIHLIAVRPEHHRRGLGRALVEHAEDVARARGAHTLSVKTLAASRPDPNYARTRAFYLARGFEPFEELPTLWGEANPCLVMFKRLDGRRSLEALARRWMALWQAPGAAGFDELHDPAFVDRAAAGRGADREAFRRGIDDLYAAFPDFAARIETLAIDERAGRAAVVWSARGTHRGAFLGEAPSGQTITFRGVELIAVRGGRVVERWGEWDEAGLRRQLREPAGRSR